MKSRFCIAGLLLAQVSVFATAQSADWLIYEGRFFRIADDPLDTFPWPNDKRPWFEIAPGVQSTGNYRGYLAIWEIRDGRLFLAGLDAWMEKPDDEKHKFDEKDEKTWTWSPDDDKERVNLKRAFASRFKEGRIFADWFTGVVRIPDGKMLKYVHFDHASTFERDILLHFEAGMLRRSEVRQNKLPKEDPKKEDASNAERSASS